ncbi:hypothetical protein GS982_20610 [Rhodococcus hoagii]|nr:hypothetical protein [Prescottella equi]
MNDRDVLRLVAEIAARDGRKLDPFVEGVWRDAAREYRWELEPALAAVRRFFSEPLEPGQRRPWLDPGHLRHLMRVQRPGGAGPQSVRELRARQPAGTGSSPEHRRRLLAGVAAELEARGVRSRVQARKPAWDADRVLPDVDAPAALPAPPVDLDAARTRLRAMTRNGADGPSGAFSGRQV